ncbi:MAG: DUF4252 domain-containing protein [Muribaculaceae bacterium]|nr:DUF4252 domain-containing protein [Muribaculaceae bacterium]
MRRLKYILCLLMCILSIDCLAQRILTEAASMKGVSSVFIGKTMLKVAGASISIGGDQSAINMSKIFKDLTSIEILSCDENGNMDKLEKKCRSILSAYPFEVLTETSGDGKNIQISGVFDKGGQNFETLLIAITGNEEVSFILLKGKIDIVTLNNALYAY